MELASEYKPDPDRTYAYIFRDCDNRITGCAVVHKSQWLVPPQVMFPAGFDSSGMTDEQYLDLLLGPAVQH